MRPPAPHDRIAVSLAQAPDAAVIARSPRAVVPEARQALRDRCAGVIHDGLRLLGVADPAALQDENGFLHFPAGTIQCTLGIVALDDRDLFLVYAPLLDLPSDRDLLLPLYRLLLELNNRFELSIAKFGLHGDTVFLSAMRPLDGLDAAEVADIVRWVSNLADTTDERLIAEFGGTSKRRGGRTEDA
ncbi:MAG: hypothetical protein HY321_17485 [Armatimonadetes bacterium]|nr:hypothetical protein [Armatimonadota bacterium]